MKKGRVRGEYFPGFTGNKSAIVQLRKPPKTPPPNCEKSKKILQSKTNYMVQKIPILS